jgi:hypothetical protein
VRWWFLLLTACGRVGFAAPGDGALGGDDDDAPATTGDAGVPAGPAVWLRMETDPDVMIVDSGGGHAVACAGATCPSRVAGKHGQGYQFTGSQVNVAPAADLDSSAGFTAAIWVNVTTLPGPKSYFLWNKAFDATSETFAFSIDSTGSVIFELDTPGGTMIADATAPIIAPGQWHHIAMTWDGSNFADYVDGTVGGSGSLPLGAGNLGLELGGLHGSNYLNGIVDDALYYTRALTAAEIQQLAAP